MQVRKDNQGLEDSGRLLQFSEASVKVTNQIWTLGYAFVAGRGSIPLASSILYPLVAETD